MASYNLGLEHKTFPLLGHIAYRNRYKSKQILQCQHEADILQRPECLKDNEGYDIPHLSCSFVAETGMVYIQ